MRVKCLDLEIWRGFIWILDPHTHVDEKEITKPALVYPLLRKARGGSESVVKVDPEAEASFFRLCDHFFSFKDVVADRFLAQDVAACLEGLEGREVVVAAVFVAPCGYAAEVWLHGSQHVLRIIVGRYAQATGRSVSPVSVDVTDGRQFRQFILEVDVCVSIADGSKPDYTYPEHIQIPLY